LVERPAVEVAVPAVTRVAARWGVLALLAGLWQVGGQLLVAPTGTATLATTLLAATVLASVLIAVLVLSGLLAHGTSPAPLTGQTPYSP